MERTSEKLRHEGTIGIHRTLSEGGPVYDVFFAPNADESACNSRRFRALDGLAEFLVSLEVGEEWIMRTLNEVRAGRSALIPNVILTDEVISLEGLDSTLTSNRRIN
jgi:hypothetical protein